MVVCGLWYDYFVNKVLFGGYKWVCEVVFIVFGVSCDFICIVQIGMVDDFGCVFCIYYGNFGGWLSIVEIVVQVFGGYNVIGVVIGFVGDYGYFWYGCFVIGK